MYLRLSKKTIALRIRQKISSLNFNISIDLKKYAVLRKLQLNDKQHNTLFKPDNKFEAHFQHLLKDKYQRFINSLDGKPNISVRKNNFKWVDQLFNENDPIPWQPNAYYLNERPSFVADPLHHAGAYYVQEASSMFFSNLIDFKPNMLVLDLCAAPGGKSTLLLNHLSKDSLLVSNELDFKRMKTLVENLTRWGSPNVVVTNNSSQDWLKSGIKFDLILIDAPCSGEGMFRKDKRTLEQWSENFVASCSAIQNSLLNDAVEMLNEGGQLVYSTCTYEPTENEQQLSTTLSENNYKWRGLNTAINPNWKIEEIKYKIGEYDAYGYYLYHFLAKGEGQFVSVLQKENGKLTKAKLKLRKNDYKSNNLAALEQWMQTDDIENVITFNEFEHYFPKQWQGLLPKLEKMQLWKLGSKIGQFNRKKFIPHHEMVMSKLYKKEQLTPIELDLENAIKYLKKEVITINDTRKGYLPVSYRGIELGWIKNLGDRANNYFPSEYKIRKDI